jgi:hypothetical protein
MARSFAKPRHVFSPNKIKFGPWSDTVSRLPAFVTNLAPVAKPTWRRPRALRHAHGCFQAWWVILVFGYRSAIWCHQWPHSKPSLADQLYHRDKKPFEIFARLNIKHCPSTEQIVRELPLHEADIVVEFDLTYPNLNDKRVEKAWIDLIFEGPELNRVVLPELTFTRRPSAAM